MESHKKSKCSYCGDAPLNHFFAYTEGIVSIFFEKIFSWPFKLVPNFIFQATERLLVLGLRALVFLKLIKLSSNKEKATTLRSRVVWDEAERRGIQMEQLVIFGKHTDNYRGMIDGRSFYFTSLPTPPEPFLKNREDWDDKFFLKNKFSKADIPVPKYVNLPFFTRDHNNIFENFQKPVIVKPRLGSRGRHTTTNIYTWEQFKKAVRSARQISPHTVMEEQLNGYVCRATCVDGKLVGFYRAEGASIVGDGLKNISELIQEKNNNKPERVEEVEVTKEILDFIGRRGYQMSDILPQGEKLNLSHRTGRLFGGSTREMIDELHPSFVPIIEKAAKTTDLPVVGFDCIIPDPEKDVSQRWGIIECNTLPFIDLHYFALEGKPRNIAGLVWDFWKAAPVVK